jgi:hypothetical protein
MSGMSRLWLRRLCMNMQRKITEHSDQPKRRNRDIRANVGPWVRTDNHEVMACIKSIELGKQIARRVYTNVSNCLIAICCPSAAGTLNSQVESDWSRISNQARGRLFAELL